MNELKNALNKQNSFRKFHRNHYKKQRNLIYFKERLEDFGEQGKDQKMQLSRFSVVSKSLRE